MKHLPKYLQPHRQTGLSQQPEGCLAKDQSHRLIATLFIAGVFINCAATTYFDFYGDTSSFFKKDYSFGELIFWLGGNIQAVFFGLAFRKMFINKTNIFLVVNLFLDVVYVDIFFLFYSDPHTVNRSKWENMGYALILFAAQLIYYTKIKKQE